MGRCGWKGRGVCERSVFHDESNTFDITVQIFLLLIDRKLVDDSIPNDVELITLVSAIKSSE